MNRAKVILTGGVIVAVAVLLVTLSPEVFLRPPTATPQALPGGATTAQTFFSTSSPLVNAFVPGWSYPSLSGSAVSSSGSAAGQGPPTYDGGPVTSLNDVASIVNAAPTGTPASATAQLLPLPAIPDSELAIDPSGASTMEDYMAYANSHYQDAAFQASQFNAVMKDKNGVILLPTDLVAEALASGNFTSIHDSLAVYQKYYTAKIAFERAIKVTGDAAALNKKVIGFDELALSLIQKDFDVEAGKAPAISLQDFYGSFMATAGVEHQELLREAGVFAAARPSPWDKLLAFFNFAPHRAEAVGTVPFGGKIGVPVFCVCDLGYWIAVGPPTPPAIGSLFVPIWVMANPLLFYPYHSLVPGAWWLGLYFPTTIPCSQMPFCSPVGFGDELYMAGTSAF